MVLMRYGGLLGGIESLASRANHPVLLGCSLLCGAALLCAYMIVPSVAQAPAILRAIQKAGRIISAEGVLR